MKKLNVSGTLPTFGFVLPTKGSLPRSGSELLASAEIIELLQQTLESCQESEKTLAGRHKHQ